MRKMDEVSDFNSCLNRSKDHEMLFVLRAHDVAAPDTIRAWAAKRVSLGKNKISDPEIGEAFECARIMEEQQKKGI